MVTHRFVAGASLAVLLATPPAHAALPAPWSGADDFAWTQWNGPTLDGLSPETEWESAGAEEHLWEAELGLGYSTVSVQDGRLVTMGYDEESGLDSVWCIDAIDGEVLWRHTYPSEIWNQAHEGGTVNTPSIDGDVVYSLNREGNLYCLELATGDVRWHTNLMPEGNPHELEYPTWGFSASPLVLEDELFLNCGRILSIDEQTGEVRWRSQDYGHAYGTPAPIELDGRGLLAVLNGRGVGVVSRLFGEEYYFREFGGTQRGINAATPLLVQDKLFVSSATLPACALLDFGELELEPVWESREMVNALSGCVAIDDHLYGFDGGVLKCIDTTGEPRWSERGIGNGAVTGTPDRLLVMGGTGELIVAKATPEAYEELSRAPIFDEGNYWTRPILVGGIVYCRSSKGRLVARDHRAR